MRQFAPLTNLLLACAFAFISFLSLGTPWYAPAEAASGSGDGAMEAIADDIAQFFGSTGATVSGTDALGGAETTLMALAVATAALALLVLLGIARSIAREGLRIVPLAAPVLVLVKAVDHPLAGTELRWGILATFALTALTASAAWQGAELTDPKPKPKPYIPPPPPAGSASPPGF